MPGFVIAILALAGLIASIAMVLAFFGFRFHSRLRRHPAFTPPAESSAPLGSIVYAPPEHAILAALREKYDLESVAGQGTEMERLARLMEWVHGLTTHARNPSWPERLNGLHLAELAREQGKRFNCWMYSIVLNDVLLSMGYASRVIHLWPYKELPNDSHVVTCVYSRDLSKWVMLDPDMCACITDEAGSPLGVEEIRARIIRREQLRVADSVHLAYASLLGRPLLKRLYIWYLSKNIFRYDTPARSEPDYERTTPGKTHIHLIPDGYHDEWLAAPHITKRGNTIRYVRDPEAFWQVPEA